MEKPRVRRERRTGGPYKSIQQKLEIVKRLKNGENIIDLADEVNVNVTTVRRWAATCHNLANFEGDVTKRCTMRRARLEDMENTLYEWLLQQRAEDETWQPTLMELQRKAKMINKENGGPTSFQASNGWVDNFITRFKLREKKFVETRSAHGEAGGQDEIGKPVEAGGRVEVKVHGGEVKVHGVEVKVQGGETGGDGGTVSADQAAQDFVLRLAKEIEDQKIHPDDVYNFDEWGLYYRALPSRSYALNADGQPSDTRQRKDRFTVGCCANATGTHKIPLLLIGRSAKPRCFRTTAEIKILPVHYRSQRRGLMTKGTFIDWYEGIFIPEVEAKQRRDGRVGPVLLLVDNARSHGAEADAVRGRFRLKLLPPTAAPLLQPLAQGITLQYKNIYRRELLDLLLRSDRPIVDFYKQFTVRDAALMTATCWEEISAENLRRAWWKVLPGVGTPAAPYPRTDLRTGIVALMGSRTEQTRALPADEAWRWFHALEQAEAVVENPSGNVEDSSDDEDDADVPRTPRITTPHEAWRIVDEHMRSLDYYDYTLDDIRKVLSESLEDEACAPLECVVAVFN